MAFHDVLKKQFSRAAHPVQTIQNADVIMRIPSPPLRPFVKRIVIVEFPFQRTLSLLPTTSFVIEFQLSGENALDGGYQLPRITISGLRETCRERRYMGGSAILLAMFTEVGALALLRNHLDAFFNTTIPIEKVLDCAAHLSVIDEQLTAAPDHSKRIKIVESFLLEHIDTTRLDPIVFAAIERIQQSNAKIRIDRLARRIGLSQSALERRFRNKVGTSPKRFESIFRLKKAIGLRAGGREHDFASIAHSAGYSDQSHFIKDFRRATGSAPAAFFRQARMCKNAQFLHVAFASNNHQGVA